MHLDIDVRRVRGLTDEERRDFYELLKVFDKHRHANRTKMRYYEGRIPLSEVNIGIALPKGHLSGLEIGCAWGAKTVDVLAARSMFDGFVGEDGNSIEELNKIVRANNLIAQYHQAARDELKLGCTFSTLSADKTLGCKIRFHSAATAAGLWDGDKGRIKCGFAIIDAAPDNYEEWKPSLIYYYTDTSVIALSRVGREWNTERYTHKMGRPLMEPLVYNATSAKPFGRSRLKEPVRRLIQGYVRTIANATIGLEFSTSPQKYLLGVSDEMYDALINQKFKQYVGNIIAATPNPETGEKPTFGQLPQGNISAHVEMLRILSTQFSAATGLTVTDTGVVNDANPTSSDAILAQSQTLVSLAQELNTANGDSLRTIALMALAIARKTTIAGLAPKDLNVVAHFKNPAMPSVAVTADAAIKIASVRQGFAETDTFLEMIGFDQADIRRIKAQESRVRGMAVLEGLNIE